MIVPPGRETAYLWAVRRTPLRVSGSRGDTPGPLPTSLASALPEGGVRLPVEPLPTLEPQRRGPPEARELQALCALDASRPT
jgi:hypothetical protein